MATYEKTKWVDGSAPPINATNLNHIEEGVFNNSNDITDINKSLLNCERVYALGAVTSANSLISYKETSTIYTGSIAYQADYSGDFLMFIINSVRYLMTSDGHLWRFNSLTATAPTKLTYTAAEVESLLDDYDEAVISKLNLKADKATTLAGYGITDAYDKTYITKALKDKLDKMPFDTVLAENSPNYVTSGTVYGAIDTVNQTIATKYDSSNVETGSGTLSPATSGSTGSEGNFIYSKNGNTVTVTVNMTKFLAGKNYIQMSGLPFKQDLSIKLASLISRSSSGDYVNVRIDGSWIYFTKSGSNFAYGETLIVTVTYII